MDRKSELDQEQIADFKNYLSKCGFDGQVYDDFRSRVLYSTDASIYEIKPIGVVFPKKVDDLAILVEGANKFSLPITARGAGSGLAGQAIGSGIIVDCSRYLTKISNIDPESRTAVVEPGVILNDLNKSAGKFNLKFGPDPASAERATMGGSIANNATGAHSIIYGMTSDHLLELDVVLSDGTTAKLKPESSGSVKTLSRQKGVLGDIYRTVLNIKENSHDSIIKNWPRTWRRVSGYGLNYLLPWSPDQPPLWANSSKNWDTQLNEPFPYPPIEPDAIHLASIIAGSEGTLAVIQHAKLRLVPLPKHTVLGVIAYQSITEACDAVPDLLEHNPHTVELIPRSLIELARSVPAYSQLVDFVHSIPGVENIPEALLVVEFGGDDLSQLRSLAKKLQPNVFLADTKESQQRVWEVRKVGLGILMSRPGRIKPVAFIEDMAVPVRNLGEFVREIDKILASYQAEADYYAHASAGCLHIRPMLDLKSASGVRNLRLIAEEAVDLTLRLGGSISAEHGDGMARGEWLERSYGSEIYQAFRDLKAAADPKGIMNPGKIIDSPVMNENLRYGTNYKTTAWTPVFHFSSDERVDKKTGLINAIEHCNGAGVCRKSDGVMCPSFQVSQDEMHSTRGRANLLRALISGVFDDKDQSEASVKEALDLCLACKGCKSECPSGVDVAKLKYEFTNHYYQSHRRPVRDYLFGYFDLAAKYGYPFRWLVNFVFNNSFFKRMSGEILGVDPNRQLPNFDKKSMQKRWSTYNRNHPRKSNEKVLFLSDAFTEYFYPESGFGALEILSKAGYQPLVLSTLGAGRTLFSKGFLDAAKRHAIRLIAEIAKIDPDGTLPIIGVEPSEIYTLCDEYPDLFPEDIRVKTIQERAWMVDEFLIRHNADGAPRYAALNKKTLGRTRRVLLHGHCYQKARSPHRDRFPVGINSTKILLTAIGYQVDVIDSGCCGMAGSFGYEKEHYEFSMKVGESRLFPAIRNALKSNDEYIISASGVSCQSQIQDGVQQKVWHPAELVNKGTT